MSGPARARSWRLVGRSLRAPELLPLAEGTGVLFARALGEDRVNEDAVGACELASGGIVFVLADGAGGLPSGARASELALGSVLSAVQAAARAGSPVQHAILQGFDAAHAAVSELGVGAATTLSVVEILGNTLRSYHAGDSGVLVTGQRGSLKLITIAHSPTGYAVEAGYLSEAEALHSEERHVVSNLVGSGEMRIEIGPKVELARFDTTVIASDGLLDNLHTGEIAELVRRGPLHVAATRLGDAALRRMSHATAGRPSKPDDLTFALYRPR